MKNIQVIERYVKRQGNASANHLFCEGLVLYSYSTPIALWCDGVVHVNSTKYSSTTSRHVNLLIQELNKNYIPHMEYQF